MNPKHERANGLVCMWCGIAWEADIENQECPKHPRYLNSNRPRPPSFDADLGALKKRIDELRVERGAAVDQPVVAEVLCVPSPAEGMAMKTLPPMFGLALLRQDRAFKG